MWQISTSAVERITPVTLTHQQVTDLCNEMAGFPRSPGWQALDQVLAPTSRQRTFRAGPGLTEQTLPYLKERAGGSDVWAELWRVAAHALEQNADWTWTWF